MHLLSKQGIFIRCRSYEIFSGGHKKNKKRGRFGIFYDFKFLRHVREYIKYKVRGFP